MTFVAKIFLVHLKHQFFFLLTALCLLISCGGPGERIKEIAAVTPTPAPPPTEREISGVFNVAGAGENGVDPYTGSLTVAPKGDNYEFRWSTTKGTRVGTGVQLDGSTAATFATTGGGHGCGVALYKIATDGSLDGRVAKWGETTFDIEKGHHTEGHGIVGKYNIDGLFFGGTHSDVPKAYSGILSIAKDGAGYDFEWNTDKPDEWNVRKYVGFGIWKGSYAAVSFGGPQCSFALYDVQSNGSLDGVWGGQKKVTFGKETAKRQ